MNPISFGIVGGGWRSEFFLRIARELPERFAVGGVLVRDEAKGRRLEERWGVAACRTLEELLRTGPAFVVTSVPRSVNPDLVIELTDRGVPVLSETPPASDRDGMAALHERAGPGAKIQVAEQYAFQPLHAARIAIARSGRLGQVSQAQVSAAHGYHGVSLIRKLLDVTFENAAIRACRFASPLVAGPDRKGPPGEEKRASSPQTIAWLDWGDRLGVFDFTGDQYFSWIRSPRVLVRGERGEINDTRVRYLEDFRTPITFDLLRQDAGENGNLEGYHHQGILGGGEWAYRNPFAPGRLSDDEIAVATCLEKMAAYVQGGPAFYSLAEASQDHHLGILIDKAAASGETLRADTQPWAEGRGSPGR